MNSGVIGTLLTQREKNEENIVPLKTSAVTEGSDEVFPPNEVI